MSRVREQASVVIPTKNRSRFVEGAVESALCADGVAEVIVVDDGSTDDTPTRLKRFGPRIRIITGDFGGAAAARNAGARQAHCQLLAFLDSDDEMLPQKVSCTSPRFSDASVGLVHGRMEVIDEQGEVDVEQTRAHERLFERGDQLGTHYADLARHCGMFTSATVIRKSAFDDVQGYDESLPPPYEDLDLYLRLSLKWLLVYEHCQVVRYRVWRGNFDWQVHSSGLLAVAKKHLESLPNSLSARELPEAKYGFLRRAAISSQTLLRKKETRRFFLAALRASPVHALRDPGFVRIPIATFIPKGILKKRRPPL